MEVELLKKYGSVSPGKIENLDGTTETVDFRFSTAIRFYHNMEDADFPLHWHAPGEIISPIEGTYTVTIAGKTVTLQPHDVLIIASGELHSIRAPKTGERYIMNYSVSYFHQIQDMAELFNTFYPFRLVTRQEDPELADQLFAVLAQIEGEYFSTNVYRESEIMALMLHFFSIFGRYEHRQNSEQVLDYPKQQDHMRRFAELCAYINNHCTERLSVEDLASRAGFSVYHFSRLFKENTGMTCHNYLVARHQVIMAGHARVFLEQARKMVDTKPRAGGQILDRETLGAVVVDVGAQLCKAAHVVLLLGVIQHLLAVLAVLIPPENREKVQHQGHDLALTVDVRAEILALYLRQHRKQLVGQFGVLLPGDKAEGVERVEQLGHVLYLMKVRYAVVHDVSLPRFGCANAVQLARCDNQHIMGLQRHGLARNRNRVGTLDGGDDLARGMPVQWEIGVLHVVVKADRR